MRMFRDLAVLSGVMVSLLACGEDEKVPAASASATSAPKPSAVASSAPPASASAAALPPRSDCPADSTGPGTLDKPCLGKGNTRLMTAKWTGKTDDKGPYFSVANTTKSVILYGNIAVFFYDKDGKQIEVQDTSSTPPKPAPYRTCAGNIFGGVMKADEKATLTFSCIKKEHVPEGAVAIEGELVSVGFADKTDSKVEFYWSNPDLIPKDRPKGGVK